MKIKICGITTKDDAFMAVDAGATHLGFNFYRGSPRYIDPHRVAHIIDALPAHIVTVGVYVNMKSEDINTFQSMSHCQIVQLHGDENRSDTDAIVDPVINVIRPQLQQTHIPDLLASTYSAVLIDAPGGTVYGGSGKLANWDIASELARICPLFLSGGLNVNNITQAIERVKPMGIDLCSSVETSPGIKSSEKLKAFFKKLQGVMK